MRRTFASIGSNIDVIVAFTVSILASVGSLLDVFGTTEVEAAAPVALALLIWALVRAETRLHQLRGSTAGGFVGLWRFIRRNVDAMFALSLAVFIVPLTTMDFLGSDETASGTMLFLAVFAVVVTRLRVRITDIADARTGIDQPAYLGNRFVAIGDQLSRLAGELNLLQAEVLARAATAAQLAEESSQRQEQAERDRQYAQEQQQAAAAVDQLVRARAEPIIEAIIRRTRRDQLMFLLLGIPIGVTINAVWRWLS